MAITPLPIPPSRSDTNDVFVARSDAFVAALPTFVTEANATAVALNLASVSDTSVTSNLIGLGAKTFVVSSGKSFQPGMYLVIADALAPSTNSMVVQVTSYIGTSLVANSLYIAGSGTKVSWIISMSAAFTTQIAGITGGTINGTEIGATTPSLGSFTGLNLSGTGARITGDFSNATAANRLMFENSTQNAITSVGIKPSGVGAYGSSINLYSTSDVANAIVGQFYALPNGAEVRLASTATGTAVGSFAPLTIYTGGAERLRVGTNGDVTISSAALLGYGIGSGGTVAQATSKATAVTLNKPSGQITMNAASLAANTLVSFTLNNSLIAAQDTINLVLNAGAGNASNYNIWASVGAGGVNVYVRNISAGPLTDALVINFTIIKGATA